MISQHSELNTINKTENLFELVYQAAVAMNVSELKKLINLGICFSSLSNKNGRTIMEGLAENGHDQAILFLTKHFYVPLSSADFILKHAMQRQPLLEKKYAELKLKLQCALKNHKESQSKSDFLSMKEEIITTEVKLQSCNQLIDIAKKIKSSSAMADNHHALAPVIINFNSDKEYIRAYVNLKRMIYDFCSGSKNEFSPELQYEIIENLLSQKNLIEQAVKGALSTHNVELFFKLCQKPLSQELALSIVGFLKNANWISSNEEELLYFVTRIKNENLRRAIIEEAYRNHTLTDAKKFHLKVEKILHLMSIEELTYEQARAWKLNLHVWFLQGIQFVTERGLPLEVFIEISSYVTGMSSANTHTLFKTHLNIQSHKLKNVAMNANIQKLKDSNNLLKSQFYISMFNNSDPQKEFAIDNQKIAERFDQRISLVKR